MIKFTSTEICSPFNFPFVISFEVKCKFIETWNYLSLQTSCRNDLIEAIALQSGLEVKRLQQAGSTLHSVVKSKKIWKYSQYFSTFGYSKKASYNPH